MANTHLNTNTNPFSKVLHKVGQFLDLILAPPTVKREQPVRGGDNYTLGTPETKAAGMKMASNNEGWGINGRGIHAPSDKVLVDWLKTEFSNPPTTGPRRV